MAEGWILIHKKIIGWEWYTDITTCKLFLHMLLKANYKNKTWQGEEVKRGELISSREKLAMETGLSPQQTRTAERNLQSTNEIVVTPTNRFTRYFIVNYEEYQFNESESTNQSTNETHPSQQTKNEKSTSHPTTTKEIKELKENKEDTPLPPWLPVIEWEAYKEMRNKIRKPMTSHAERLAIKKLENFQFEGKNIQEILNYSILNNYQGIFEPKENQNAKTGQFAFAQSQPTKTDRLKEFVREAARDGGFAFEEQ